ncbi:MAG: glycine oxidase ThiO [Herpetosiphon sp.]
MATTSLGHDETFGTTSDRAATDATMVTIIGAGIQGLAIGWYLARAGRSVTIVERDTAGHGASWAAAGMLAPHVEAEPGEEKLLPLLLAGQELWPDFARELEQASGLAVGYRSEGTLVVALDHDDARRLKFQADYARSIGLEVELLSGYAARRREPHLASTVTAALYSSADHQVDNRLVVRALREAFLAAGGILREHTPVTAIMIEHDRVHAVRLADETLPTSTLILAAGAWSRSLEGLTPALRPPVRPVKGQMLALQMSTEAPLVQHVVWGPGAYLVPRGDGRLLIGATVEERGWDPTLTAGGLLDLLRAAWETLPGIYDLPVVETWAGFRPGSRDDAPILGRTPVAGLLMATGHYRNGILLTPITAQSISRLILTGETMPLIEPFNLARFDEQRSITHANGEPEPDRGH